MVDYDEFYVDIKPWVLYFDGSQTNEIHELKF